MTRKIAIILIAVFLVVWGFGKSLSQQSTSTEDETYRSLAADLSEIEKLIQSANQQAAGSDQISSATVEALQFNAPIGTILAVKGKAEFGPTPVFEQPIDVGNPAIAYMKLQPEQLAPVTQSSLGAVKVAAPNATGWVNPSQTDFVYAKWQGNDLVKVADAYDWKLPNSGNIIELLLKKARDMKKKYEDNSYIGISGFTVSISIPPSLNIDFEFK